MLSFFAHNGVIGGAHEDFLYHIGLLKELIQSREMRNGYHTIQFKEVDFRMPNRDPYYYVLSSKTMCIAITATLYVDGDSTRVINMGEIPCMCPERTYLMDAGGYFVIDGQELAVPIREIKRTNVITGYSNKEKNKLLYKHIVKLRCKDSINVLTFGIYGYPVYFLTKDVHEDFPWGIPLRALLDRLGVSIRDVISHILWKDKDSNIADDLFVRLHSKETKYSDDAIRFIDASISRSFGNIDDRCLLVSYMLEHIISMDLDILQPTDLDSYRHKRLITAGGSLLMLYAKCFRRIVKSLESTTNLSNAVLSISSIMYEELESKMFLPLRTGCIVSRGRIYGGFSNNLGRKTLVDTISSVRKICLECDQNSVNAAMRMIHPSQRMFVCISETPESKDVGLIKSLAATCIVSTGLQKDILHDVQISKNPGDGLKYRLIKNGSPVGYVDEDMLNMVDNMRRTDCSLKYVTMSKHGLNVVLNTDSGRPMRPNHDGVYVDPDSEESDEGQSDDIHPSLMSGIAASLIPFSTHNHGPRNVFSSSMIKQAISMSPLPLIHARYSAKHLVYGQDNICSTIVSDEMSAYLLPNGCNVVVAIMTYGGFNQEDAIIVNKSSIERGLFHTCDVICHNVHLFSTDTLVRTDCNTDTRYDDDGVIKERQLIGRDDLCLAYMRIDACSIQVKKEKLPIKTKELYNVMQVTCIHLDDGDKIISFVICCHRTPKKGDKLSSRHSQKGVIGHLMQEIDMPWCENGVRPDIIINPHAIPSRMTVGQILEMLVGKKCSLDGTFYDASSFNSVDIDNIGQTLLEHGYDKFGEDTMMSGVSGEILQCSIFIGVPYYLVLRHFVCEKIRARGHGVVSAFSGQPVSGSKDGGLRFGEMEVDTVVSHAANTVLRELHGVSDKVVVYVCIKCGNMSESEDNCPLCNGIPDKITVPYSMKMFKHLMDSCNIKMSFKR